MARTQCSYRWVAMLPSRRQFFTCNPMRKLLPTRWFSVRLRLRQLSPARSSAANSSTLQQLQQKLPLGFHTMMPDRGLSKHSEVGLRNGRGGWETGRGLEWRGGVHGWWKVHIRARPLPEILPPTTTPQRPPILKDRKPCSRVAHDPL